MSEACPLVSVIMAVYNGESTLASGLKSVQDQTLEEIEIICVDDGSSDRTGAILDAAAKTDARVRVLHKTRGGVSAARNAGLDAARGKYVTFIDADDEYTAMHLKSLVAKAESGCCDVVQIGYCEVTDGVVTRTSLPNEKCTTVDLKANPDIIRLQTKYVWDKLYRREMIEANKIRFASYGYHEDHLFLIDVDLVAKNFGIVSEVGYRYSRSSSGAATRAYDERLLDCPKAYADICRRLRKAGLFKEAARAVWANCSTSYAWRIWAFREYGNKRLQAEIVRGWHDFFQKNFPRWQKNLHLAGLPVVLPPGHPPKVLLLGSSGVLVTHLRDTLAEQGMDVWVTSRANHEDAGNVHYLKGNATDRKFFNGLMASHWDVIVDFVVRGPISFEAKLPILMRQCGQYVFLGSSQAYADAGEGHNVKG